MSRAERRHRGANEAISTRFQGRMQASSTRSGPQDPTPLWRPPIIIEAWVYTIEYQNGSKHPCYKGLRGGARVDRGFFMSKRRQMGGGWFCASILGHARLAVRWAWGHARGQCLQPCRQPACGTPPTPPVRSFVQKHPARGLWNAKAARLCKWGLSSLPRGLTSLAVTRYRHGALLSYTRTAYGHSSALEYRRTRTKHCPKGPDTKGGLWGSWPLELRCTMAVFGNPEGCGNELGKPSLGGDSRRIMHPNQGRYPGVGAPIGALLS